MQTPNAISNPNAPVFAAFIGLDRSDAKLDLCLLSAGEETPHAEFSVLENTPEKIAAWLIEQRTRFAGQPVALALEQPAPGLLAHLQAHGGDFVTLFALNPVSLARYRESLQTSRAKCDAGDAFYLMKFARENHRELRPFTPGDAPTQALGALVEGRRAAVDLRTQLCNQLQTHLKGYFPQALQLVGDELYTPLCCDFLLRWPSLPELKRAHAKTVRQFYVEHNSRRHAVLDARLQLINAALPLAPGAKEAVLLPACVLMTRMLAAQLKQLGEAIRQYDAQIAEAFAAHQDAFIFASFPGAGPVNSARLLVAFGGDRAKFADAQAMQNFSGIAPIIKQSGNTRLVQRRLAKPHFVHQTFVEYADQSLRHCAWAKAFYRMQRERGKRHWAAVRSLAFKWIRILYRCWHERVPYDEAKYLASLRRSRSPLCQRLAEEASLSEANLSEANLSEEADATTGAKRNVTHPASATARAKRNVTHHRPAKGGTSDGPGTKARLSRSAPGGVSRAPKAGAPRAVAS